MRSVWYGCSLTCSRSSALSGPAFSQVPAPIATRPRSWTSAALATVAVPAGPNRQRWAADLARSATPAEWPARWGDTRSAKPPIATSARSIASPSSMRWGCGSQPSTSSQADASGSSARISRASSTRHAATSGSSPCPACSRTTRTACSSPPRRFWSVASTATWTIRIGSGISSLSARRAGLRPSQRSVRCAKRLCADGGRPMPPASSWATSHIAVRCGPCSRASRGSRRAVWSARAGAAASGWGSARRSPVISCRADPYITGLRCVTREPPKRSAVTWASAVQPEWESKLAK